MISLLKKDLLILRRSRLLVGLLIVYPVAIALLIGLAISRSPAKPRVAILDETSPGETVQVAGQRVEVSRYVQQLFSQVQPVEVGSRGEAVGKVRSAEVLAAVVIPSDIAARVGSGTDQGELEVIYNGDALEQSLVQSQLRSALGEANLGFSRQIQKAAAHAIDLLLQGGNLGVLGAPRELIGLRQIPALMSRLIARAPPGEERAALRRVATFADFAAQNLDLSKKVLTTVGQPITIHSTLLHGRRTPLDTFAVVVAVTISLMFLGVLLAAGGVALEREENTLARLLRGLVSRELLLLEKGLLAAGCAFLVALAMLLRSRRLRRARLGEGRPLGARPGLRRALLRRARGGHRRPRPRGTRRVAARLSALSSACPARARARRLGRPRPLSRRSAWSPSPSPSRPPCRHWMRRSIGPRLPSPARSST